MRNPKYLLLRQLTFTQILAVVVGIACLSAAYFTVTRATFRKAMRNEREKVALSLKEQQEKWRTWKQVGLMDALQEELASHSRVFSLSQLEVLPLSQVRVPLSDEEVLIPEPAGLDPDGLVVWARLNRDHIEAAYVPYLSNLVLLILSGFLFCFVILFSTRFIRKHIYLPFQELRQVFESINAVRAVNIEKITAAGEIREFIVSLVELYKKLKENEKNAAMFAVAKQVAHDIRSPLAALDMILDTLAQLPERKRLIIRGALGRIRDIANDVLERARLSATGLDLAGGIHSVASLVESIVTEKQVLVRSLPGVVIETQMGDAYSLFAKVPPNPFKIVLSNLMNNALEAIAKSGTVRVSVEARGPEILLTVWDNGKGIPSDVLAALREWGGSYGKTGGSGLGLAHAKFVLEGIGGRLELTSSPGVGTKAMVYLPAERPPPWFLPGLTVAEGATVLVLDDDPSIHLVWQQRFEDAMKQAGAHVVLTHFSEMGSVRKWFSDHRERARECVFLCDYEIFGAEENGIRLIESLGCADKSILVTGRFDEESIRVQCERLGIRLLAKGLGGCVPVRVIRRASGSEGEAAHHISGSLQS